MENPLPPCPDSPNCVRTTRVHPDDPEIVWEAAVAAIDRMQPAEKETYPDEYRLEAVFQVFFFKDDLVVRLEASGDGESPETGTYLHIRSSSRVGYSDLGVNRRRVKTFFGLLERVRGF
ncbi:MAG: DUF1499 domain-containing protein [Balneolaceae bacterium]|nr:DUF1499 domain-containing protein [Balneolaceae bacterium]